MTGIIADIQRFSLHDGPGIRTNIYMKGCNMRCAWCHNPETIQLEPQLQFVKSKCIGCGSCIKACPSGAVVSQEVHYDRNLCKTCFGCTKACPAGVFVKVGTEKSVEEVMKEVLHDLPYYHSSGGGITVTGGEPLMQTDFVCELMKNCKQHHIHTAIETNLSFSWDVIENLLSVCNLFMYDVKSMNPDLHLQWTGKSNYLVLQNSLELDKADIPVIVRTPLIPGVNDDVQSIEDIAGFVSQFKNVLYYELLPYNALAEHKYNQLGEKYEFSKAKSQSEGQLNELLCAAMRHVETRLF